VAVLIVILSCSGSYLVSKVFFHTHTHTQRGGLFLWGVLVFAIVGTIFAVGLTNIIWKKEKEKYIDRNI
jgi:ABC-type multidrug transport system permease subunit